MRPCRSARWLQLSEKACGLVGLPGTCMGSIPVGAFGLFPKQESRFLGD